MVLGEGNGNLIQYSCLENLMDGGAWKAAVHGVAKSRTWLSDFTFTFHFHALEKVMAIHSSALAWRIPGMGAAGGLPSMGKLSTEEFMLLNCGVGEDSWESLGLQGDLTSPFWRKSALGVLERNDAKAETPVLWPPHEKSWLIGKDSDAGRDWGQEKKEMTEDEMAGWHHWLDGLEFEWTPGDGDGQGGLACCDSWGRKESDTTEWLNWNELIHSFLLVRYSFVLSAGVLHAHLCLKVYSWCIRGERCTPCPTTPVRSSSIISFYNLLLSLGYLLKFWLKSSLLSNCFI